MEPPEEGDLGLKEIETGLEDAAPVVALDDGAGGRFGLEDDSSLRDLMGVVLSSRARGTAADRAAATLTAEDAERNMMQIW